MISFISKSLVYPKVAKERGIQGKVVASFVDNKDGSLSDVEVTRSVDPSLDREVVRIVKPMPQWIPGTKNGVPVRVRLQLPIEFSF